MKRYIKFPAAIIFFAIFACGSSETPANKINESSVTLITHDSFAISDGLFDTFTSQTGITVEQLSLGDTGQLISSSILTKENPIGDVVFGVDNTFLSRALNADILVTEDEALEISLFGFDEDTFSDNSSAILTITQGPSNGTLDNLTNTYEISGDDKVAEWTGTYTPNLNYNGSDSILFTVTDEDNQTSLEGTLSLTINSVNDTPVLSTIDDIQFPFN